MLDQKLVPTRLVRKQAKVTIKDVVKPSRFRLLYVWFSFIRLFLLTRWLKLRGKLSRGEFARRLRGVLEELGGVWIKLGQLLSLRNDVFSTEFCRELSELQDRATGFPGHVAQQTIERELDAPVEKHFEVFEQAPFAAASLGQVHRARLRRGGGWVAIKIQRPDADWTFRRELAFVRYGVRLLKSLWFVPNLNWDEMLWELDQILEEELDYRHEAAATARMRQLLKKQGIYVHKVYLNYCTKHVLVTEYVQAVLMSDYIKVRQTDPSRCEQWCAENNINPSKVAKRLFDTLWRQLLENNFFHGDLHPGNIILLRDSQVSLIDFGAVGSMEKEYQQKYNLLIQAMAFQNYAKAADLLLLLAGALPERDLNEVKQKLIRCFRGWELRTHVRDLPYHRKSMSNLVNELVKILFQYECTADWSFLRITRAQETVDNSIMHLDPRLNYTKLMTRFFRQAQRRARARQRHPDELNRYLDNLVELLKLPELVAETAMYQQWIRRRQSQIFRGSTSKIADFFAILFARLSLGALLASVFFFLAFLHQHHQNWLPRWGSGWLTTMLEVTPALSEGAWFFVLAISVYSFFTLMGLKRRFAQKERQGAIT